MFLMFNDLEKNKRIYVDYIVIVFVIVLKYRIYICKIFWRGENNNFFYR